MSRKTIGWTCVCGCVVAVALAVFANRATTPPAAEAAASSPRATPRASSEQATLACQAVADKLATIQQGIVDEQRKGLLQGLAALDQLTDMEFQIDTSQCPADFRKAMLQYVMVEDAARIHAHADNSGRAQVVFSGLVATLANPLAAVAGARSVEAYDEQVDQQQQRDLASLQSAMTNLEQVAKKYGVK
jgi:hypothetical protein